MYTVWNSKLSHIWHPHTNIVQKNLDISFSLHMAHFTLYFSAIHGHNGKMHGAFDRTDMVIEMALSRCQHKVYVFYKYRKSVSILQFVFQTL